MLKTIVKHKTCKFDKTDNSTHDTKCTPHTCTMIVVVFFTQFILNTCLLVQVVWIVDMLWWQLYGNCVCLCTCARVKFVTVFLLQNGWSPLYTASFMNNVAVVKTLTEEGANVDQITKVVK